MFHYRLPAKSRVLEFLPRDLGPKALTGDTFRPISVELWSLALFESGYKPLFIIQGLVSPPLLISCMGTCTTNWEDAREVFWSVLITCRHQIERWARLTVLQTPGLLLAGGAARAGLTLELVKVSPTAIDNCFSLERLVSLLIWRTVAAKARRPLPGLIAPFAFLWSTVIAWASSGFYFLMK